MIPLADAVALINARPPAAGLVTAGAMRRAAASGIIVGRKIGGTRRAGGVWLLDLDSAIQWAETRKRGRRKARQL